MKYLIFKFFLLSTFLSFGQASMEFHVASLSGKYNFKDYEKFGDTYNSDYANIAGFSPLKMKTLATGVQIGATLNIWEWLNASIDLARVRTGVSKAGFDSGFERCFQLRSFLFDLDAGFYVIPESSPIRLSVGLGITFESTQIHSFMEYGDTRSYGTEITLNGVWSTWKGYTPLVLKLSYLSPDEHWKFFINGRFPIQGKKTNSVGFIYSAQFTSEGQAFPADYTGDWGDQNRLSENYRFINVAVGVAYHFSF